MKLKSVTDSLTHGLQFLELLSQLKIFLTLRGSWRKTRMKE